MASEDQIKKQKQIKAGFLGHVTRILGDINEAHVEPTQLKISVLMERLSGACAKYHAAAETFLQMISEEADIAQEIQQQSDTSDMIALADVKLKGLLATFNIKEDDVASNVSSSQDKYRDYAGLPKLKLPTFSGDPLDWRPFLDQFNASVDSREIPAVQKLTYLLSALDKPVKEVLKGLSMTAINYAEALKILKTRFGDPSLLIGLNAERISDLKPVEDGDLYGFGKLVDTFESAFRELTQLIHEVFYPDQDGTGGAGAAVATIEGSKIEIHHLFLAPVFARRLPPSTLQEWLRRTTKPIERFDLHALLDFVKKEIESQRILHSRIKEEKKSSPHPPHPSTPKKQQDFVRHPKGATSALSVSDSTKSHSTDKSSKNKNSKCSFCEKSGHRIYKCQPFLSLDPVHRKEKVEAKQLCINCLGAHSTSSCPSEFSCFTCSKKHNTLLHTDRPTTSTSRVNKVSDKAYSRKTILQTALVFVKGLPGRPVRILLDSGAEISYVKESLVSAVEQPEFLDRGFHQIESFGGHLSSPEERSAYLIHFRPRHSQQWLSARLVAVPKLCGPQQAVSPMVIKSLMSKVPPSVELADVFGNHPMSIDIILGLDALPQILLPEAPIKVDRLLLTPSKLGYVVGGTIASSGNNPSSFTAVARVLRTSLVDQPITKCMSIKDPVSKLWDLESIGITNEEVANDEPKIIPVRKQDRYEIQLPWIDDQRPAFSKSQAIRRLHSSFLRLPPQAKEEYISTIEEYHELGILETADGSSGNFLPHHSVLSKKKRRIVYDASAKPWKGSSLNEHLHPGPNLLADLTAILLRFRTYNVPLCGDVEKAFLMVGIDPADREYLKLVWFDRKNSLRISRFTRVPFGINAGPYLLLKTLQFHFIQLQGKSKATDEILQLMEKSLYMDDLIAGRDTKTDVLRLRSEAKNIFQQAGMNIHNFISFPCVMKEWTSDPPPENHKVLGIPWHLETDTFQMALELSPSKTKREALSSVASVFDPLGLVSPWHIKPKIFIQSLWAEGGGWDSPLSTQASDHYSSLLAEVENKHLKVEFPRFNNPSELHVFVDASRQAYAAVVYGKNGKHVNLLCSRARVTPLRPATLTIPRLELMANLLGARLAKFLCENLSIPKSMVHFYTDSMISLGWIQGTPTEVFVRNRVKEIRLLFDPSQWSHIIGKINPADLPSRGVSAKELITSDLWKFGPEFLSHSNSVVLTTTTVKTNLQKYEDPIPVTNYSSRSYLTKVTAWINRFASNCRKPLGNRVKGPLSLQELKKADQTLLRSSQLTHGTSDYLALQDGKDVSAKSCLWNARPFLDQETSIIMCSPRHGGPPMPWLPIPSSLAVLIILDTHSKLYHLGTPSVVTELNRIYWTSKTRSFVKSIVGACVSCRRIQSRRVESPEGGLPTFRTEPSRPFAKSGLDHFGPLYLKDETKVWVLIFTCSVVRAIHMEVVSSLNITETSLAIRRFFARWGPSEFFLSDHGSSFMNLAQQLKNSFEWKLIPPTAPWWGGFWERMIGTVKRSLKKTLKNTSLTFSELTTVLAELEDRVNRRPLVQSEDTSLTPTHFLKGLSPPPVQGNPINQEEETLDGISRRWQHRLMVSEHLWKRWKQEYLPTLRQWRRSKCPDPNIKPGDLVLVHPPDGTKVPRGLWPLARIEEIHHSELDQKPRSATIRMRGKTTSRPLSRLYPLEAAPYEPRSADSQLAPNAAAPISKDDQLDQTSHQGKLQRQKTIQPSEAPPITRTRSGREIRRPQRY